MKYSNHL